MDNNVVGRERFNSLQLTSQPAIPALPRLCHKLELTQQLFQVVEHHQDQARTTTPIHGHVRGVECVHVYSDDMMSGCLRVEIT